jgi:malonyl-CoA/methylmalonyl-CoA synthetase
MDLFRLSLQGRASEGALEFQGVTYTFGDLEARANRMARALLARGLTRGDRMCVYLANCAEYIDLYLAAIKTGIIFVPVNILYRERELSHITTDAVPQLFVDEALLPELNAEAAVQSSEPVRYPLDGDDPAAIVYTSGTTGTSKGAVLTHNVFLANTASLLTCWRISSSDRFLLSLPLFHVHGLGNGVHCWLASGCRTRLLERFEHQKAIGEFQSFEPTLFFGVPTIYVRLLDWPEETARATGAKMRLFVSGSAPLPAQVMEDFHAKFGHHILERYGMSETLMNLSNPYEGERRPGTVGFPLPGVSARILDPEGNEVPPGTSGEVHLKGPNVFAGYWNRKDATESAFRNGWFKTGDIGVRSDDGYYSLQGRKSDLIIAGGFNIYPREIEELLMEQPGVREAAVVGVPDKLRGEVPVAYIVGTCDTAALEAECRAKLASFKVPRAFVPVEFLPRTALGKVQKHLLPKP